MGTMGIHSVGTIVAIDLMSTINLVGKKFADVSENWWTHVVKIDGNDEFCDSDIGWTFLTITIDRKLKFGVEIGANTTCKGGLLMLLTTKISLSKIIRLEVSIVLTSWEIMTLWVDG